MSVLGELRGEIEDRLPAVSRRARPPATTSILLIGTDGDTERMVCLWRTEGRLPDCGGGDFGAGVVETAGPVQPTATPWRSRLGWREGRLPASLCQVIGDAVHAQPGC